MYSDIYILLAWLIIFIDLFILIKNKNNPALLISNFFIFYFNYSICIGEYIAHNVLIPKNNLYSGLHGNIYEIGIILLFIFTLIRLLFVSKKIDFKKIEKKDNIVLFWLLYIFLIYIGLFQVNREASILYEVKIKPMYEYSVLVFALLFYFSGQSRFRRSFIYLLAFLFIVQDAYYGGRATSLQILILIAIFEFSKFIKLKYILSIFPFALLIFTTIAVYRSNYSIDFSISDIYNEIIQNLFVQDTAVYAYFASMTHVNAKFYTDLGIEITSLIAFIGSVVFGSAGAKIFNYNPEISVVSKLAQKYHWNVGGGVSFTWFYFWLGYPGVIAISSLMMVYIRRFSSSNNDLSKLILLSIIITTPRWYLYSPLAFFRGPFIFMPLIYFSCWIVDKIIRVNSGTKEIN